MMKLIIIVLLTVFVLSGVVAQQQSVSAPVAELTFMYTRISGPGSNQYAVWIEDAEGKLVKTLYASRWTAAGGYARRPMSIPLWIKQSGRASMTKAQADAVSGATPKAGAVTHTWDGTDANGKALPTGDYVLILEGTLRMENQVYYRVPITLGKGTMTPKIDVEYVGDAAAADRNMIKDVKVRVLR